MTPARSSRDEQQQHPPKGGIPLAPDGYRLSGSGRDEPGEVVEMTCHRRTCFNGRWRVSSVRVLDTMEHDGETYALIATRYGHEVLCTMIGAWLLKLGKDVTGWKEQAMALLDTKGDEKVADTVIDNLQMNDRFGLTVRTGVWE